MIDNRTELKKLKKYELINEILILKSDLKSCKRLLKATEKLNDKRINNI